VLIKEFNLTENNKKNKNKNDKEEAKMQIEGISEIPSNLENFYSIFSS
jgi:hypothetical protein